MIRVALAVGGAMQWQVDHGRQCMVSDAGYAVTKSHIERGFINPQLLPVYRAFTPTGGFLGACGEREDAEELCERHRTNAA